jgi:probable HAF family extracellular repeat protein
MEPMSPTKQSRWYRRRPRPAVHGAAGLLSGFLAIAIATASHASAMAATAPARYSAEILSTLCTDFSGTPCPTYPLSNGAGINDRGWIVGDSNYPGTWIDPNNPSIALPLTEHATLWRNGQITDLGTLGGPNSSIGFVARPNNTGLISGNAQTATVDPFDEQWALNLGCTPTNGPCDGSQYEIKGFAWKNGVIRELPTLGGNNALAFGVANDQGQLSGVAEDAYHDPSCASPAGGPTQVLDWEPVVWGPRDGEIRELPLYPGDHVGSASAINDKGQVVGGSGFCGPIAFPNATHALLWQRHSVINLGSLGGSYDNLGTAINNRGQVVGWSDLPGDAFVNGTLTGTTHAFLWQNGVITDLGTLPGDTSSYAYGINDPGQVVGQSCDQNGNCRAFLWNNGSMFNLNLITHLNGHGSFDLVNAEGINARGEITGIAVDNSTTDTLGFSAVACDATPAGDTACTDAVHTTAGPGPVVAPSDSADVLARTRHGLGVLGGR